jgi:hypothetical protein
MLSLQNELMTNEECQPGQKLSTCHYLDTQPAILLTIRNIHQIEFATSPGGRTRSTSPENLMFSPASGTFPFRRVEWKKPGHATVYELIVSAATSDVNVLYMENPEPEKS